MKDRIIPCIYYVCKDADCKKGFAKVTMKKSAKTVPSISLQS